MLALGIAAAAFLMVVVIVLFARQGGPTRSVAHVLYDAEHPPSKVR